MSIVDGEFEFECDALELLATAWTSSVLVLFSSVQVHHDDNGWLEVKTVEIQPRQGLRVES
jgi:hypothetical protein